MVVVSVGSSMVAVTKPPLVRVIILVVQTIILLPAMVNCHLLPMVLFGQRHLQQIPMPTISRIAARLPSTCLVVRWVMLVQQLNKPLTPKTNSRMALCLVVAVAQQLWM